MEVQDTVTIVVGGKKVKVPQNTTTSHIRHISGLDQSQPLARSINGLYKIVHGNINVSDGDVFIVGRSFTKGTPEDSGLLTEIGNLSDEYNVYTDDNLRWIPVYDYALQPGYKSGNDILFNVEGYPYLPPGNAYGIYTGLLYNRQKERYMFNKSWTGLCTGKISRDARRDDIKTFLRNIDLMLINPLTGKAIEAEDYNENSPEV